MTILVYSKTGCPFCSLLKLELGKRGLEYREYDLSDDLIRKQFYENSGTETVPQVFLSDGEATLTQPTGRRIGGWSDVSADWQVFDYT